MKNFKTLGLVTAALFTASITLTACGSGTTKTASTSAPTAQQQLLQQQQQVQHLKQMAVK